VVPLCATAMGWNTTVKVPSGFWVTDWYGTLGMSPVGAQSAGEPVTKLLAPSGQIPLGTVSGDDDVAGVDVLPGVDLQRVSVYLPGREVGRGNRLEDADIVDGDSVAGGRIDCSIAARRDRTGVGAGHVDVVGQPDGGIVLPGRRAEVVVEIGCLAQRTCSGLSSGKEQGVGPQRDASSVFDRDGLARRERPHVPGDLGVDAGGKPGRRGHGTHGGGDTAVGTDGRSRGQGRRTRRVFDSRGRVVDAAALEILERCGQEVVDHDVDGRGAVAGRDGQRVHRRVVVHAAQELALRAGLSLRHLQSRHRGAGRSVVGRGDILIGYKVAVGVELWCGEGIRAAVGDRSVCELGVHRVVLRVESHREGD
jgi:hypothetical protein